MTKLSKFPSHADEIAHLMATSAEVSPLPIRRPVAVAEELCAPCRSFFESDVRDVETDEEAEATAASFMRDFGGIVGEHTCDSASCCCSCPHRPVAYPETLGCFCTEEGVAMERLTATDIPGETPAERYERGCNECFVCPECGYQELFPFASMTVADIRRFYPGWGSRRNAGHGSAA